MKRRSHLVLIVVLGLVAVAIAFFALHPREPVYLNRPLSFWFDQFKTTNSPQAAIAIGQIGTEVGLKALRKIDPDAAEAGVK